MTAPRQKDASDRPPRKLVEEFGALRSRVDDLERANAEHAEFSEAYRALIDNSAQGLVIIQDGRVVFANRKMVDITGYRIEEMKAKSANQVREFIHPEDREAVWNRHSERLAGKTLEASCEFRGIRKGGEIRWLELHANRITYRSRVAIQAACVDITDRIEAAQELAQSEQRYRALFEAAPIGIGLAALSGRVVAVNKAMEDLFGYTTEELRHLDISSLYENPEGRGTLLKRLEQDRYVSSFPARVRHKNGRLVDVQIGASLVQSGGQTLLQTMCTDVTKQKQAQAALWESEARYKTLVEGVPVSILVLQDGKYVYANAIGAQRLGYEDASEVVGKEPLKTIDPTLHATIRERIRRTAAGEHNAPMELKIVTKRGVTRWMESASLPITLNGQPATLIVGQDITDRKEAEDALRESEGQLTRAQEVAHVGSWFLDIQSLRLTWSDETYRIFGLPIGIPMTDEAFLDCIHPGDFARQQEAWAKALQGAPYDIEHRIVRGDKVRWVRERAKVEHDTDGKPVRAIGTVQDITDQKMAILALEESEKKFRVIANYTYDLELWVGTDGGLLWMNPAVERFTGYTVEECKAMSDFPARLVHGEDRAHILGLYQEACRGRSGNDIHFRVVHRNGSFIWVSASWQPVYDVGGVCLGWRCSLRDVDDRVRTETALREATMRQMEAVRAGNVGLWDWNVLSNKVNYSAEWKRQIGHEEDEIGDELAEWQNRVHPDDLPRTLDEVQKSIAEATQNFQAEFRFRHQDGSYRWILARGSVLQDKTGRSVRMYGSHVDITERKEMEQALLEEKNRAQSYLDIAGVMMIALDVNGNVTLANRKTMEILGCEQDDIVNKNWFDHFIPARIREEIKSVYQRLISGELESLECCENSLLAKGGEERTIAWHNTCLKDTGGMICGTLSSGVDITEQKKAAAALERHRAELQAIYDHSPVMMCVLRDDGQMLYANRAFAAFTRMHEANPKTGRPGTVLGCIYALTDPRGCGFGEKCQECPLRLALENTLRTGNAHHLIEYRSILEQEDGRREVVLLGSTTLIHDGEEPNLLLCLQDITSRVEAEQRVRRTTELLSAIREAQLLYITGGAIKDVYEALLSTLIRMTDSEYGFLDEVSEDEQGMYKRSLALSNIAWDEASRLLYRDLVEHNLEFRNLNNLAGAPAVTGKLVIANDPAQDPRSGGIPRGHPPLKAFMGIPLYFGGQVVGVVGVGNRPGGYDEQTALFLEPLVLTCAGLIEAGRNSRRERQYVDALRESEGTARALLDTPGLSVLLMDPQGTMLDLNRTLAEILGLPKEKLVGRSIWDHSPASLVQQRQEYLDRVLQTKQPCRHEECDNGRWSDVVLHPILDSGGRITRIVVVATDVTDRRDAEKEAQDRQAELLHVSRLTTLGEMASGLAHELNQPLSAILNYGAACSHLASAGQPDLQRIAKNIERIVNQADRAKDIMGRIRDFAQRRQVSWSVVDLNRAATSVIDLLSWEIRQKGIQADLKLDDQLPPTWADAIQIEQVLLNLVRNAIEAMDEPEVEVRNLTIRTRASRAGTTLIKISDTGIGLPAESPERVFDAFFSTKKEGLGIGLSISRTIMEMHNGSLEATSNVDGGSTFIMRLPIVTVREDWQCKATTDNARHQTE